MTTMDQVAVASELTPRRTRSCPDACMRRLFRVPSERPAVDESETHRIFGTSIFLSALRCLLSYVVFPVVLPAIGVASSVGPYVGIPIGVLALTFDYLGARRFWLANHHQRWAFTALYAVVGVLVFSLLITDIVRIAH